ncbi:hypothetical protein WJX77_007135 [Trebouxia sp. C0004]
MLAEAQSAVEAKCTNAMLPKNTFDVAPDIGQALQACSSTFESSASLRLLARLQGCADTSAVQIALRLWSVGVDIA